MCQFSHSNIFLHIMVLYNTFIFGKINIILRIKIQLLWLWGYKKVRHIKNIMNGKLRPQFHNSFKVHHRNSIPSGWKRSRDKCSKRLWLQYDVQIWMQSTHSKRWEFFKPYKKFINSLITVESSTHSLMSTTRHLNLNHILILNQATMLEFSMIIEEYI